MKNKSFRTATIAVTCIVLVIGAFIYWDYQKKKNDLFSGEVVKDNSILSDRPINALTSDQIDDETITDEQPEGNEDKLGEEIADENGPVAIPNLGPQGSTVTQPNNNNTNNNTSSSQKAGDQTVWKSLEAIVKVGGQYYADNYAKVNLISRNGIFYNYNNKVNVTPSVLVASAALDSMYVNYDCTLLLLSISDVKDYSEFTINNRDDGMTVFGARKHEGKYYLTSASGSYGILSEARYHSLMARYSQQHGATKTPYPYSDPYDRLINFIKIYEGRYSNYYVREMVMDNKYAMVVLSSESNTADVRQYILKNQNDNWEVVMDGLENEQRVLVAINRKIPDFNINMIPNYTISKHKAFLTKNSDAVVNTLINAKAINGINDIIYQCSVERFGYVVTKTGFKYLLYKEGDVWAQREVFNYAEAVEYMETRSSVAPTFIVWDK